MKSYTVSQYSGWLQITPNIQIYYSNLKIKNRLRYSMSYNFMFFEEYNINHLPNKIELELNKYNINSKTLKQNIILTLVQKESV